MKLVFKRIIFSFLALQMAFTMSAPSALAIADFDKKAAVTDTAHYDPTPLSVFATLASCFGDIQLSGDNVKDAYVFFFAKLQEAGVKDAAQAQVQAAGIIGNLQKESTIRLDPTIQQDKSKDPFPKDGVGFGIAQWTYDARQKPLVAMAKKLGLPPTDLKVQLSFLWHELNTTHDYALRDLKKQTTIEGATVSFQDKFEACGDCRTPDRIKNAKEVHALAQQQNWVSAPEGSTAIGCVTDTSAAGAKIVQIAMKEVGTAERNGNNGGPTCKYQGTGCPQAWCADFISWVYKQAGYPFTGGADGGWRIATAVGVSAWFKKNGTWIPNPHTRVPVDDPRAPKPGDVILYPKSDANAGGTGHVNIVVSYDGKTVKTVGGNQSHAVTYGEYYIDPFEGSVGWGRLK